MHRLISAATAVTAEVAAQVRPEQLDLPTPCREWTVRVLANHLVHWTGFRSELSARREPFPADGSVTEDTDHTGGDWSALFADRAGRAARAWAQPGALDGETELGGSTQPAQVIAALMLAELVIHGWDLAMATGRPFPCPPEVAEATLRTITDMAPLGRSYGIFDPEVPMPESAPALDRALAISGRDPAWRPEGQLASSAHIRQSSSTP